MKTKATIAVVTVAVIIIILAATYICSSGDNTKKDAFRTDLEAGDYMEFTETMFTSSEFSQDMSESDFLSVLYPDMSYYSKIGEKVITYKGQDIPCDIYQMGTMNMFYYVYNGVSYGNLIGAADSSMETLLTDTSFDLSKTADQQKVAAGSFYSVSTTVGETVLITEAVAETFDGESMEWSVLYTMSSSTSVETETLTITAIDGDKLYVDDGSGDPDVSDKTEYLSRVSYSYLLKYLDSIGYELGSKSTDTISTPYGARQVTVQEITVNSGATGVLYYSNDILYEYRIAYGSMSIVIKLESTSLVTPANL